ncbi:glycosyltransferase family 39 protein [Streptomyces sp. NPDC053069]|uniref:glycosyltransferase family 39 protein n=1 Tax=Streptomyces sp. NPDC053069 TaxID=3365695 RepID=UPI0037CF74EC
MLGTGLWGLDRGGMWRDEAVSFQVGRRTVPQIWQLLHDVDAVHGLYYLLMHAVLAVHPGEVVLRLPSVCAAALTAALVAALGTRLARPRVGLWAGLLYAVAPMAGHYAQEGRSYALVAAGVTGATLLLVRALQGGSWWGYGAVLGVTCWLHEFAVLVLCAHAGSLALARVGMRAWRGWGCAAGGVVLSLLPMAVVSWGQAAQVAWLRRPTASSAEELLRGFLGPAAGVYAACLALALLGLSGLSGPAGRRGQFTLPGVALPLTVVPPMVLMSASQISPLYVDRYVLYALSGAPLLVAGGAEWVAGAVGRLTAGGPKRHSSVRSPVVTLAGVLAICLAFLLQLPLLREDRDPRTRADDLGAVSRVVAREARPGDAVVFVPGSARNAALGYPRAFRGVRDVALAEGAAESGTLYGREAGAREVRDRLARLDRVWVVADPDLLAGRWSPRSPVERTKLAVLRREFAVREEILRGGTAVRLYVRKPLSAPAGASRGCRVDHPGVAGPGTHICRVVVTRRRSASTPSSALQLHAPDPARVGRSAPLVTAGLIRTTPPSAPPPVLPRPVRW